MGSATPRIQAAQISDLTIQHTITPGDEKALAGAIVWRRFDIPELPAPLLACVLITVPANKLVGSLPAKRMPAFLAAEDWAKWLGEEEASPEEVKAMLKTVEGARWSMNKEERKDKAKREKPTVSDPGGLF